MGNLFGKIWKGFSDLIFVNFSCMICGRETQNSSLICDNCEKEITFINGAVCNKCGAPTEIPESVCYDCFNKEYRFDNHRSCIIYNNKSSVPVKALKYSGKKYLAEPIAKFMYAVNKELVHDIDYITFVPMHESKLEERGYNHTEEIAKCFSKISGVPLLKALIKTRDTGDQARLGYEKRTTNLRGSFACECDVVSKIENKNILIIDDVFTTGSTINECTKILLTAKAYSVVALTFLKTDPRIESESFLDLGQ